MSQYETNCDSEMRQAPSSKDLFIDLEHYRKLVKTFINMRRYRTALFWAEKVIVLSKHDPKDVYWLAQCMFLLKEYYRAAHIIKQFGLEKSNILCHYLAVESLYEAKEYQGAFELINSVDSECLVTSDPETNLATSVSGNHHANVSQQHSDEPSKMEILSSIAFLKGKILEAMDNRTMAMECYIQALHLSVYCTEALDSLVQHEMLMAWEEKELITQLPLVHQCNLGDRLIVKKVYDSKLKKYYESDSTVSNLERQSGNIGTTLQSIQELAEKMKCENSKEPIMKNFNLGMTFQSTNSPTMSPINRILNDLKSTQSSFNKLSTTPNDSKMNSSAKAKATVNDFKIPLNINVAMTLLNDSVDMRISESETLFYNCEYKKCLNVLDRVLKIDPYHTKGLSILIGCLIELKEFNRLFYTAHKLVDLYPDQAISWYAVGCYYDLIGKSEPARRYFSKATTLDRLFGPAWLAYGHSFAKENEHDQAMAAYFKATQLMRGCHLPLLYIGVECGLTKNLVLAEKFFNQAMSIAPLDVFVLHEFGVIIYEYEKYFYAEEIFRTTLDIVKKMAKQNSESISPRWEPLLNNLGHCCRKNQKYQDALLYHQSALILKPQTASTYTCIGIVQAYLGEINNAVESLHKSLALKRDDIVTSTLLKYCVEDLIDENIFEKVDEVNVIDEEMEVAKNVLQPTPITKLRSVKLKFEDDSNLSSDAVENSCDMSMDV